MLIFFSGPQWPLPPWGGIASVSPFVVLRTGENMRARHDSADFAHQFLHWLRLRLFTYPDLARVNAALSIIDSESPSADPQELDEPVFILATSWRSGSTLLQRVFCTDPSLLLWGEPFGRLALIPRIVSLYALFHQVGLRRVSGRHPICPKYR